MSDVLIKGMEMPQGSCEWVDKDCHLHRCKLLNQYDDCNMQEVLYTTREEQFFNCPLVEIPNLHGRLIDADALIKELKECMYAANNNWEYEMVTGYSNAIESVEESCTIIEAEGNL